MTDFKNFNLANTSEDVTLNANYFSAYKGQYVIKANLDFNGGRSGSFGVMILDKKEGTEEKGGIEEGRRTVKHEWGHFVQLGMLGPKKYVEKIAIPSVSSKASYKDYYYQPWERSADIFGGVDNRPGAPYYDGSYAEAYNYIFGGNSKNEGKIHFTCGDDHLFDFSALCL